MRGGLSVFGRAAAPGAVTRGRNARMSPAEIEGEYPTGLCLECVGGGGKLLGPVAAVIQGRPE